MSLVPPFIFLFVLVASLAVMGVMESKRFEEQLKNQQDIMGRLQNKIEYLRWDVEKLMKPKEEVK